MLVRVLVEVCVNVLVGVWVGVLVGGLGVRVLVGSFVLVTVGVRVNVAVVVMVKVLVGSTTITRIESAPFPSAPTPNLVPEPLRSFHLAMYRPVTVGVRKVIEISIICPGITLPGKLKEVGPLIL